MTQEIKPKRLLIFLQIVQSWIENEDKNVDVEFIKKQLKINCPICMDEMKLKTSTICGHIVFFKIVFVV